MAWETFPYSYTSLYIHSWIFETLQVIIFWVRVTHKKLNVNSSTWITHPPTPTWPTPPLHDPPHHTPAWHTPPLHDTPHPTSTWPTPPHHYMTHPTTPLHDPPHHTPAWPTPPLHDPPHPMKWKFMKIHSIILSVTCHSLRNFLPLTHIPLYPLMNFWNPMGWSGSYMGGVG